MDPPVTVQTNPTLVPPLPEPLHWPTVAAVTDVMPGVLTGVQIAGAPGPVISEPTHWYTVAYSVAAVMASRLPVKWFVIVTVQFTVPPPPLPDPLHCWTVRTGAVSVVVAVVQVSEESGPDAPTHLVVVIVEGGVAESAPVSVT